MSLPKGFDTMPQFTKRPAYCPLCQRLYRSPTDDYLCVQDGGGLIGMSDPLPKPKFLYRFRHNRSLRLFFGLALV